MGVEKDVPPGEDLVVYFRPADRLLSKVIHEEGGPLLYSGSEEKQRSFNATCRELHRFRTQPQP
jgi:hypothetical protein